MPQSALTGDDKAASIAPWKELPAALEQFAGNPGRSIADRMTARQFRACALVALLASTRCGCQEEAIVAMIGAEVRRGPGHKLAFSEVAFFDWDRVCLFGPYTSAAKLVQITGLSEAARATRRIESSDGIALLLFLDSGRIVKEVTVPRDEGDFAPELLGKCYSRGDAVFAVRAAPANSSGNIGPVVR